MHREVDSFIAVWASLGLIFPVVPTDGHLFNMHQTHEFLMLRMGYINEIMLYEGLVSVRKYNEILFTTKNCYK